MAEVTLTSFTPNTTIKSSEVNTNLSLLATQGGAEHTVAGKHDVIQPVATKQNLVTSSDGATITFDLDTANIFSVTLGGNRTLALSNVDAGQAFLIRLVQDGTGSRTVTWFSTIKWVEGTVPVLTTTAGYVDSFGFICTSAGNYDGYIVGQRLG